MSADLDPASVNLDTADPAQIICYLNKGGNDYNGQLGARVSAIFVILLVSSAATFFPVLAARVKWLRVNIYVYLFARYFGAGVIVATAFIHLLDPAYSEIGPQTCVGMTGHWADYAWCPAIVLTSIMLIFLLDFGAERWVESKYGFSHSESIEDIITDKPGPKHSRSLTHHQLHSGDQDENMHDAIAAAQDARHVPLGKNDGSGSGSGSGSGTSDLEDQRLSVVEQEEQSFRQQIAAFLILEFGVIFHSVIIGLNLGTTGAEFATLYPVLVFHQSFEGLGIGARMSAIPFPKRLGWLPWFLCAGYGLTTPVAIAIGLGLRNTYDAGSTTANIVSGVLDATSAGILIYTGLVELLARDFLFNPELTRDSRRLVFMVVCLYLGGGYNGIVGEVGVER
ncbi:Zinc-regulated transporter [Lachnellula hyalina]|uniref:Zinc-regulated transporter n=1 Tax=Lachnellula hyalina TaxID=1316788 RepID=A0A8H8R2A2_9HELO|nr:Zinc-regulated transporter [Lachnellula hyalina]TVY26145.1 Zinc-regulated transporter [Lachnellula hyalina]